MILRFFFKKGRMLLYLTWREICSSWQMWLEDRRGASRAVCRVPRTNRVASQQVCCEWGWGFIPLAPGSSVGLDQPLSSLFSIPCGVNKSDLFVLGWKVLGAPYSSSESQTLGADHLSLKASSDTAQPWLWGWTWWAGLWGCVWHSRAQWPRGLTWPMFGIVSHGGFCVWFQLFLFGFNFCFPSEKGSDVWHFCQFYYGRSSQFLNNLTLFLHTFRFSLRISCPSMPCPLPAGQIDGSGCLLRPVPASLPMWRQGWKRHSLLVVQCLRTPFRIEGFIFFTLNLTQKIFFEFHIDRYGKPWCWSLLVGMFYWIYCTELIFFFFFNIEF